MDTFSYSDDLLPNIYYTPPKDYKVDVNPPWTFRPTELGYPMSTQHCAYYPPEMHSFPYLGFITNETSRAVPINTESSSTVLDPTATNIASEGETSIQFLAWDSPSSDTPSTTTHTASPSSTGHQPEGVPPLDVQIIRVKCELCNRSFSNQNHVDTCFLGHLGMGSFHCYGACGDALW
jgi:hypothetical protein